MTAILIIGGISAFILACGLLSFSLMFQDVAPSQNSYAWPYLIPTGALGLLVVSIAAIARWLT